jgi:hypothetical protein
LFEKFGGRCVVEDGVEFYVKKPPSIIGCITGDQSYAIRVGIRHNKPYPTCQVKSNIATNFDARGYPALRPRESV